MAYSDPYNSIWKLWTLFLFLVQQILEHLPGNAMHSAFMFLSFRIWTSFLHWVDFPALSQPSNTIRAPLPQFGANIVLSNEQIAAYKHRPRIRCLNKLRRQRCTQIIMSWQYYRKTCKYSGRRSKSSAPKLHPWCTVVADNTEKVGVYFKKICVGDLCSKGNCTLNRSLGTLQLSGAPLIVNVVSVAVL